MRQVNDMPSSLMSSVLVHAGLLLIVFGVASALFNQQSAMIAVAIAGGVALAAGVVTRKPSQKVAYRAYLMKQEEADLVQAKSEKWMDKESAMVIEEELAGRKS